MSVGGTPVNMPTHAHGQGYSDLNFLIPELVAGVQFSKGPYFAEQGDFATAGSSNITYATELDRPIVHAEYGAYGFGRALFAASPKLGKGHLLAALETSTNDGPWTVPDAYRTFNGFSLTAMGYHGKWNATEASPTRAVDAGLIDRFGSIDPSDGGVSSRYAAVADWQHGTNATLTKVTAYGIAYDLDLFSNFTFFLDDPVRGDQIEQLDHRFVAGAKVSHRRLTRWRGHPVQNTFGVQLRNDDIPEVALYHTEKRVRLDTRSMDAAVVTTAGVYAQNEIEWTPWLRTSAGLRLDGSRYRVDALDPANSGIRTASLVSPKTAAIIGPWKGTELYLNAGTGFHSNNALGTTITRDANGAAVPQVTPLVRAKGAEVGLRTVALRHLQTTVSLWMLGLDSELVYDGDTGSTRPGPASERRGIELANYFSLYKWLTFDGDVSLSRARFTGYDAAGQFVPEAVGTVVSAGASVDRFHRAFGSVRVRYFGPRALVQDDSVRSKATSLVNLQGGYQLLKNLRVTADVFNLFNERVSDIDYFFASRLPGEPLGGVEDIHFHPAVPRTIRISVGIGF
jgi:outer membrane receptor protein involved in Fe transport